MVTCHLSPSLISMEDVDRLGVGRPALVDYYTTARALAAVADQAVSIGGAAWDFPAQLPEAVVADLEELVDAANVVFDDATTADIEGAGVEDANDVIERYDGAVADNEALEHTLFDGPDSTLDGAVAEVGALTRALDDLARAVGHGGAITEVALRAATRAKGERGERGILPAPGRRVVSMITLYARRLCPYCWKVKRKLRELDLEYETRYVSFIKPLRSEVREISGQTQVPVIVDPEHGVSGMNESDDIVAYLEETYGGGSDHGATVASP